MPDSKDHSEDDPMGGVSGPPPAIQTDAAFLHEIYQTALLPNRYDTLMLSWGARIEAAVEALPDDILQQTGPVTDLPDDLSAEYLQTSLQILHAIDKSHNLNEVDDDWKARAKFALDQSGRVIWYNGRAQEMFLLARNSTLDTLGLDPFVHGRLTQVLKDLSGRGSPAQDGPLIVLICSAGGEHSYMITHPMLQSDRTPFLLLEESASSWNSSVAQTLQRSFGLTPREIAIVEGVCDGKSLALIAVNQARQIATVRTQMKSILRKTATNSQAQLVRLVLSIAAHVESKRPVGEPASNGISQHVLPDGRAMPYHVFGPASGRPVLYIHGMLDGLLQFDTLGPALKKAKLRIIAPERPGFGSAQIDDSPIKDRLARFCADICDLLDALGIARLPVVGHMTGSVYSFAMAAHAPQRISAVYNVAGAVPMRDMVQLRHMSKRQRTVAFTARFFPSALPLILLAGIRQIKAGGISNFVHAHYENSPVDIQAFSDPQIASFITDGVQFGIAQGYHAVEADIHQAVQNWSDLIFASTCPVTLVHGRQDRVVIAASVTALAQDLGTRCRLVLSETAGQTVLYTQPDLFIAALMDSLD